MEWGLFSNQGNPDNLMLFPLISLGHFGLRAGLEAKTGGRTESGGYTRGMGTQPAGQPGHVYQPGEIGNGRKVTKLAGPDAIRQRS